ncbi:MAG TPA: A24 family peptidase [Isosphaeraceae bacterium]
MTVVTVVALIAAITDIRSFRVSNFLTLPLLVSGLVYQAGFGPLGLVESLMGALSSFALFLAFYLLGGMGAGDVKLMAGVGAWLGMPKTFQVILASSILAGVYAIGLILWTGTYLEAWVDLQRLWVRMMLLGQTPRSHDRIEVEVKRADRRRRLIPFAAMVGLGTVATWFWNHHVS